MHSLVARLLSATGPEYLAAPLEPHPEVRHQALVLLKPECFLAPDPAAVLDQVVTALETAGSLDGAVVVQGPLLGRLGTMDRHYRAASALSRGASHLLTPEDRQELSHRCGLPNGTPLLGGHELLERDPSLTPASLDAAWVALGPRKLRSGTYAVPFESAAGPVILVNGFYPAQAAHFTAPGRQTAMLLLHSDQPWAWLRQELLGDTYPERAQPGSIRRTLLEQRMALGLERVDITANFVHLSAGPLEALWELQTFFSGLSTARFDWTDSSVVRRWSGGVESLEAILQKGGAMLEKTEGRDLEEALAMLQG